MTKPSHLTKHRLISRQYKNNTSNMFVWKILAFAPKEIEYVPTAREGNVFTGVCHSFHNRPHGYSVTAHPCYSAVGTHSNGMLSCWSYLGTQAKEKSLHLARRKSGCQRFDQVVRVTHNISFKKDLGQHESYLGGGGH